MKRSTVLIFASFFMSYMPYIFAQDIGQQRTNYNECLNLVEKNSEEANAYSQKWFIEGGGVAALHCQALSLYEQEKFGPAASLFEDIIGRIDRKEGVNFFIAENKDLLKIQLNYLSGLAWRSAGEFDRAYNAFSASIIDLETGSRFAYDLYIERGHIQVSREDPLNAIEDFTRALEINSERIDAFLYRAETYRKLKEHLKARLDLNVALSIDPNHPDVLFESGINYRLQNRNVEARTAWLKLIDKYPNTEWQSLAEQNIDLLDKAS